MKIYESRKNNFGLCNTKDFSRCSSISSYSSKMLRFQDILRHFEDISSSFCFCWVCLMNSKNFIVRFFPVCWHSINHLYHFSICVLRRFILVIWDFVSWMLRLIPNKVPKCIVVLSVWTLHQLSVGRAAYYCVEPFVWGFCDDFYQIQKMCVFGGIMWYFRNLNGN